MKKKAICILSDHPELIELNKDVCSAHNAFKKEVEELQKIAEQKSKFYEKTHNHIWAKIIVALKDKGLLPSEFNEKDDNHTIRIDDDANVIYFIEHENKDETGGIHAFLKDLFTRD